MQEPFNRRLVFTVKDLQDITGFGLVKCREIMKDMRTTYKLPKHQFLLVYHASKYLRVPTKELLLRMR
ncbi:hypothetical protein [Pedobacter arcticus]|uniref:hypothetical protein n=1 Tax=Pedobacter arcticus TaxID=752140 RepID=UPI0002EBE296|nr:hypothetical protein [Pedobacter arcticus]